MCMTPHPAPGKNFDASDVQAGRSRGVDGIPGTRELKGNGFDKQTRESILALALDTARTDKLRQQVEHTRQLAAPTQNLLTLSSPALLGGANGAPSPVAAPEAAPEASVAAAPGVSSAEANGAAASAAGPIAATPAANKASNKPRRCTYNSLVARLRSHFDLLMLQLPLEKKLELELESARVGVRCPHHRQVRLGGREEEAAPRAAALLEPLVLEHAEVAARVAVGE
eukprot:CAMPEP_0185447554 /NCGR_PEP_ID=MMETSP1365-20130426/56787_1 /TAXON_ID=38817 /ORGANISM="Gephyrocapsa oceanica, Strain RCC1303" /LENGTH=226 /DNA_ID=CAMNT_0028053455 /DNA_START=32 /DNA_END=710 /DNA_ORIENTATION=-